MGACLSCLGIRRSDISESERARLLYPDDPYNQSGYGTYGNIGVSGASSQNIMSAEEVRREREALDNITRWANDQVVEIFPHQYQNLTTSISQLNGNTENSQDLSHLDILLSMIPGDKSKKSIRVYPSSRPSSGAGDSSIKGSRSAPVVPEAGSLEFWSSLTLIEFPGKCCHHFIRAKNI